VVPALHFPPTYHTCAYRWAGIVNNAYSATAGAFNHLRNRRQAAVQTLRSAPSKMPGTELLAYLRKHCRLLLRMAKTRYSWRGR